MAVELATARMMSCSSGCRRARIRMLTSSRSAADTGQLKCRHSRIGRADTPASLPSSTGVPAPSNPRQLQHPPVKLRRREAGDQAAAVVQLAEAGITADQALPWSVSQEPFSRSRRPNSLVASSPRARPPRGRRARAARGTGFRSGSRTIAVSRPACSDWGSQAAAEGAHGSLTQSMAAVWNRWNSSAARRARHRAAAMSNPGPKGHHIWCAAGTSFGSFRTQTRTNKAHRSHQRIPPEPAPALPPAGSSRPRQHPHGLQPGRPIQQDLPAAPPAAAGQGRRFAETVPKMLAPVRCSCTGCARLLLEGELGR